MRKDRFVLVGREAELSLLRSRLDADRPVVVVGEPGLGKTTLLRAAAAATGRQVFEGGALATLSWMEHLPLRRALGRPPAGRDIAAVADDMEAAVGSGVLILDDLQWCDVVTFGVIAALAGRVALAAGVRTGTPGTTHALDTLRGAGFDELRLNPLPSGPAANLARALRPELNQSAVERLLARSGGNPLLIEELAAGEELSPSLRLALAARLRALDVAGRDAFAMLALAGHRLTPDQLGRAGVKSLLAADLAVTEDGARYVNVRHALLADVAVELLEADERKEAHARIARVLTDVGDAARHYALAGERRQAHDFALRAARMTDRPGERATHLAVAAEAADGPEADALRLEAARALDEAQDWPGMVSVLDSITSTDPQTQAWGALLRARNAWGGGDPHRLRAFLAEGLELVGGTGSEIEVRLRIEASRVPIFVDGDAAEGVRSARAALELAQATGVEVPRAQYLLGTALSAADDPACVVHLEAAMAGARASADVTTELLAAHNLIVYHESSGSPDSGRRLALLMIDRARSLGFGVWERDFEVQLLALDWHLGSCADVVERADRLLAQQLDARTRDYAAEALCISLVDLGRIDEATRRAQAALDVAVADFRGQGNLTFALAEAALWGGRPAEALELVERFLAAATPGDPNQMFGYVLRAWARFDLGRDPGPEAPEHPRPLLLGVPHETCAVRLLYVGEHAAAAQRFDQAAALWAPYHRRGELRCLWAAGEAVRRSGNRTAAVGRLEAVEARAAELGFESLLNRIRPSLRAVGVRRSAPRTIGARGLTGRESEVLALAAKGLTNAQIASRLGIGRRTVVAQIDSASLKLGATSRGQAAALAGQG